VAADPVTRTFPVEVEVADKSAGLHAGQVVEASLSLQTFENVTAVPIVAVHEAAGTPRLMRVKNGKAASVSVTLGPSIDDRIVVTSGIAPGDEVVVVGGAELEDGAAVEVTRRIPPIIDTPQTPFVEASGAETPPGGDGVSLMEKANRTEADLEAKPKTKAR
jgi:hypothetical protein